MIAKLAYILSKKDKLKLFLLFVIIILSSALELIGISVFMPFIKILTNPEAVNDSPLLKYCFIHLTGGMLNRFLAFLALLIIVIYIVKNIVIIWCKDIIYRFSYRMQRDISIRLLTAYMNEDYTFHLGRNSAVIQRSLVQDCDTFSKALLHSLELLNEILVCLIIGIYLFRVSYSMTIAALAIMMVTMLVFTYISRKSTKVLSFRDQNLAADQIRCINQSIGGIKELIVLGREKFAISNYSEIMTERVRLLRIIRLVGTMPKYVVEAAGMSGIMLTLVLKIFWGQSSIDAIIPQLSVFAAAAFRLMPSVGRINEHLNSVIACYPSVNLIYSDLKDVEGIMDREECADKDWKFRRKLTMANISYHYPDSEQQVLSDFSFEIPCGSMVALIGSSGAGKSTIADIILGLLKPQRGVIMADDLNVLKNVRTWQNCIGYIPQTIYLSDDTIRNNIAFGIAADKIDEDAVKRAAEEAQLAEFIKTLPDGLDTVVGERGARLSGGQRQRIGIARALYHDPEVLVLDEATSALDNETEAAVIGSIDALHGSKTMIIIAHRLTTIRNADYIYEVKDGTAVLKTREEVFSS